MIAHFPAQAEGDPSPLEKAKPAGMNVARNHRMTRVKLNSLFREAIMYGVQTGRNPVEYLLPFALEMREFVLNDPKEFHRIFGGAHKREGELFLAQIVAADARKAERQQAASNEAGAAS